MAWFIGLHIVTVFFSLQAVLAQTRDDIDKSQYKCHCSCSSPYHPESIVMTTAKLRRQGYMLTMDTVSMQDSTKSIRNLLDSTYESLKRTLSDIDRNQLEKLRESLQVQNGGKMPKDMAVTIVDLFKKALYAEENNIANKKQGNVPDIRKASLTNSNGFISKNMQAVIEEQNTELKQWQKTEEVIKQNHKAQQQSQTLRKDVETPTQQTKPKAYTLRTLNSLIKSATERLVELYGKAQAKNRQNSSLGPTKPPNQQAFRNERVTVDEAVRGKPHSSYESDNHGFWTQEKGSIVESKPKEINAVPTTNSAIGPRYTNTNVPQEITRTPLSNIITSQPNLNTNVNDINDIPLSNTNNEHSNRNTNYKETDNLSMSSYNGNGQTIDNTNYDKIGRLPLSNSNTGPQNINSNAKNSDISDTLSINSNKNENTSSPLYEVPGNNRTKPTVYVTVEPNPSSIAYYKPNVMSSETNKSDRLRAINEITGSNLDIKGMLDLSVSEKMSNIGPTKGSIHANELAREIPTGTGSPISPNTALDDALFHKISNASPETRSLFTDAMLKEIPNGKYEQNIKFSDTSIKKNDISSPKQGKKSIQMSPRSSPNIGASDKHGIADANQQHHTHIDLNVPKQPSSNIDILDGMFGNHIGETNAVNMNPIGLPLPEQTIQSPLGNEWDALLKQSSQSYVPSSNLQHQNTRNSAQDIMNVSELYKLLSSLSKNQKVDTHYIQSSTASPNNADQLAMAMMFGAWRK